MTNPTLPDPQSPLQTGPGYDQDPQGDAFMRKVLIAVGILFCVAFAALMFTLIPSLMHPHPMLPSANPTFLKPLSQ